MSVNSLLRALSHSLIAFRMPPRLCSSNSASLRAIRRHSAIKQWATPSAPSSSWKRAILIASSAPQWQSSAPWAGASIRRHYAVGGLAHGAFALPADYVPPTQPPSAKKPEFRKSQLLRAYTSLLRSTPLLLIFQHNNLTSVEWMAVRRELRAALDKVPAQGAETAPVDIAANIRMNVTQSRIFGVALKIVEFFDRASVDVARGKKRVYDHDLSEAAFKSMKAVDSAEVPRGLYLRAAQAATGRASGSAHVSRGVTGSSCGGLVVSGSKLPGIPSSDQEEEPRLLRSRVPERTE